MNEFHHEDTKITKETEQRALRARKSTYFVVFVSSW